MATPEYRLEALVEEVSSEQVGRGRLALIKKHVEEYGMGSNVKNIKGYVARGGEAPFLNPNELMIVGLDTPETSDNWFAHCARLKDETDADLEDYLEHVRSSGKIDKAITVYRDGDRRAVLDGRRSTRVARLFWAEQAKVGVPEGERISVRVITVQGSPEELFRVNTDSHRQKPLTKVQIAKQTLTYFQKVGEDVAKTATFFKVSEPTVRNRLALLDLSEKMQHRVDAGEIPEAQAVKLAKLPRDEQEVGYAELVAAGATKGAAATNGIAALRSGRKVDKADKTRVRSKPFLEKLSGVLKEREIDVVKVSLPEMIRWFLGGPEPESLSEAAREAFTAAQVKK